MCTEIQRSTDFDGGMCPIRPYSLDVLANMSNLQIILPDGGNDIYVAVKQYVFISRLILGTT